MPDAEISIDQKRKETENQVESGVKTVYSSSMGFLTSTAKAVFWTSFYFALGAIVLYCSKIGKANILPEENTCIPKIPGNEINIFIDKTNNTSQKFKFNNSPICRYDIEACPESTVGYTEEGFVQMIVDAGLKVVSIAKGQWSKTPHGSHDIILIEK